MTELSGRVKADVVHAFAMELTPRSVHDLLLWQVSCTTRETREWVFLPNFEMSWSW
ncbi:MAG: hypothetical protein H7Z40_19350 [Phycisphaerae bacterium]|nr:hypothetical protein [Gemmatimonadaceae bacterium]